MSEAPNRHLNLNYQQQFRLNKINEVKDNFIAKIRERELMSKRVSKCIDSFDYFDKSFIVLSGTYGGISIALFATVIWAQVLVLHFFSITIEIWKKYWKIAQNKNEKYNNIIALAKSKLNSIESIISEAPINNEMCHEGFTAIINEEKTIDNWKNALEW